MPEILVGQNVDAASESALDQATHLGLARTGAVAETFSRAGTPISAVATTSGNGIYAAINLVQGQVINNIGLVTNSTAAVTPTHAVAGIFSPAKAKLATSADLLTAAWAANTEVVVPLTAPFTVPVDGVYYIGFEIVAGTPPTLSGVAGQAALNALAPVVAFGDTTALTTALPATATVSAGASQIYAYVS